jgi:hypothetical protein
MKQLAETQPACKLVTFCSSQKSVLFLNDISRLLEFSQHTYRSGNGLKFEIRQA